jgi:hypothetical protein
MDIDMDASSVVVPGADDTTPQLDPALMNPPTESESSTATPAAAAGALPPPPADQAPISQDQTATPTPIHPDEAVPRIAFQQVQ